MPTNRDLQRTAAFVLSNLLEQDLPEVNWYMDCIGQFTRLYTEDPQRHELLNGQADSHEAVRKWAAHMGVNVGLRRGDTPDAAAVIEGIGVRVWCAPKYRDDVNVSEE